VKKTLMADLVAENMPLVILKPEYEKMTYETLN
jgi:hypothetical protein